VTALDSPHSRRLWLLRCLAPACGLALLALATGLWFLRRDLYFPALGLWHLPVGGEPFIDWRSLTGAIACAERGLDVYRSNPCNPVGRPYDFPPIWLAARFIPTTSPGVWVCGLALDAAFFASLGFVFRPANRLEALIFSAAAVSSMSAYAAERANPDLLLFLLLLAATALACGGPRRRLAAYGLIFFGGVLKIYPLAALVVAVRERTGRFLLVGAAAAAGFALYVWAERAPLVDMWANIPRAANGLYGFGSANLPNMETVLTGSKALGAGLYAALIFTGLGLAAAIARAPDLAETLDGLEPDVRIRLLGFATVATGCFLAGQSNLYRGIFFIPVVADLMIARRGAPARGRLGWLVAAIVALMWENPVRFALLPHDRPVALVYAWFLIREAIWWWLAASLLAILALIVWRSPALALARRRSTLQGTSLAA
jgi:hypothetical protein